MLRYHLWAAGEKALEMIPGGDYIYNAAGRIAAARSGGRYAAYKSSFPMTRKGRELIPPGGEVVEVGTGWFHHDAILLWLIGEYRIHLFDVVDKARLSYIKKYLRVLREDMDRLVDELGIDRREALARIDTLLQVERREDLYRQCGFVPCITQQVDTPFLPEQSIDFMISYCVLGHIRPHILVPELIALRRMLKPDGYFCTLIGHDDHWAFHDPRANQFNFYRYSDRTYSKFFETRFEYHNRMVKREWDELFARVGFDIVEYHGRRTERSLAEIRRLPHLDKRFATLPEEELAVFHSYYLLRPKSS